MSPDQGTPLNLPLDHQKVILEENEKVLSEIDNWSDVSDDYVRKVDYLLFSTYFEADHNPCIKVY